MRKFITIIILSFMMAMSAYATTRLVPGTYATIQDAVDAASANDIIQVATGTYVLTANINITIPNLTIQGISNTSTKIQVSGTGYRFSVTASGFTLQDMEIEKTDKTGEQDIIWIDASNVTIKNNVIHGQFVFGDVEVSRAIVVSGGLSGLLIDGNTFYALRQPCYLTGTTTGSISNNNTYGTKGWVMEGGNMTFTGNTWGTGPQVNVYDIAILSSAPGTAYTDIVAISNANNDAVIEDQRVSPAVLSVVRVDASTSFSSDLGGKYHPYSTIEPAITRVVTGGKILVANGTYTLTSTLNIAKSLSIIGESEVGVKFNLSSVAGYGFDIHTDGITLKNFTVLPNPTTGTYALKTNPIGTTPFNNLTYDHITIDGSKKTAFDVHGYNTVNLTNLTAKNTISGVGVALSGCKDVNMSGITTANNSWGGIAVYVSTWVLRGTTNVNFDFSTSSIGEDLYIEDESGYVNTDIHLNNWSFGINNEISASHNFTAYTSNPFWANAVAFGASLNTKFGNMLTYCWDPSLTHYYVGPGMSIQRAIDKASNDYVVQVLDGTYVENIKINKSITLNGRNMGIDPCTGTRDPETIIYPAVNSPADWSSQLIELTANNITIDGLTLDGDNPSLGGIGDYNVSQGIIGYTGQANVIIKNNIIKNMATGGVILADDLGSSTYGNIVENNKIDNINPIGGFGIGVYTGNNTYTDILNNCMTNVRKGIQGNENNSIAKGGAGNTIWSGNSIQSYKIGIWNNLVYGTATPVDIKNNTVTTVPGSTINSGIEITSIQGDRSVIIESDNKVTGAMCGINLWNNPTNISVTVKGTFTNCDYGVFANNYDGYNSSANSISTYTVDGAIISGSHKAAIYVKDNPLNAGNWWVNMKVVSGTFSSNPYDIMISGKNAFAVNYIGPLNWFVENVTTATEQTLIQHAIDGAQNGDKIFVDAGIFAEVLNVNKNVTIQGIDRNLTVIKPAADIPAGDRTLPADNAALIVINSANTVDMNTLTVDAAGKLLMVGIINRGIFNISNCNFANIKYADYEGYAIDTYGKTTVDNCSFTNIERVGVRSTRCSLNVKNSTYTGKGNLIPCLDYFLEIRKGCTADVTANKMLNILGVAYDASTSCGVQAYSDYPPDGGTIEQTVVNISNNIFENSSEGVNIGTYNDLDNTIANIHQNSIVVASTDFAIIAGTSTGTATTTNATCNWFGTSNPSDIAAKISGPVIYNPFLITGGNSASIGFTPTGACEMPPIAYYKLDKCTGDQAPDEISPKADGSLHYNGIYPQWVAGHKNQCLRFIGDDNYVNLGTPDKLNFKANNSFTISVWVKPFAWNSVGNSDQQIFTKGNGPALSDGANSTQYELKKMTRPDNHADVVVLRAWHNGNAVGTIEAPISNLPLNSWTHIVAEYECTNPAAGTGTYRLYFNGGNKVESNNNQSGPVVTNERCIIGAVSVGSGVVQDWWNGLIDEVKVYNLALNDADVAALYNSANIDHGWACDDVNPPMDENLKLALRLDPYHITDATPTPANGTAVSFWKDLATSPQEEDATMSDPKMQPKFVENGVNGAGVQFSYDYGKTAYGNSKILRSDAADEIMTTNTDMWVPAAQSKTVFVVFKTGASIGGSHPYYSDGRQCIFEAGGPLSGYNMYIVNGKIVLGMWNAIEQEYQILDGIETNNVFYPFSADKIYLAQFEYNGTTKKFRVVFSNEVGTAYSNLIPFSGLSRDLDYMNDNTGIGGASRTRYDAYSTGETYSDNFGGIIGDVLVYNSFLDDATNKLVYKYLNDRLGTDFVYPDAAATLPKIGNQWITVEKSTPIDGFISSAYPNPFVSKTSFSINLPEKQFVDVKLLDDMGNTVQTVFTGEIAGGIHDITIDGAGLVPGMYVYKVTGTNFVQSGKVVLMK